MAVPASITICVLVRSKLTRLPELRRHSFLRRYNCRHTGVTLRASPTCGRALDLQLLNTCVPPYTPVYRRTTPVWATVYVHVRGPNQLDLQLN